MPQGLDGRLNIVNSIIFTTVTVAVIVIELRQWVAYVLQLYDGTLLAEVKRVDADRTYEAWQLDLLELVVNEDPDRFSKSEALCAGGETVPVNVYRHHIMSV